MLFHDNQVLNGSIYDGIKQTASRSKAAPECISLQAALSRLLSYANQEI